MLNISTSDWHQLCSVVSERPEAIQAHSIVHDRFFFQAILYNFFFFLNNNKNRFFKTTSIGLKPSNANFLINKSILLKEKSLMAIREVIRSKNIMWNH